MDVLKNYAKALNFSRMRDKLKKSRIALFLLLFSAAQLTSAAEFSTSGSSGSTNGFVYLAGGSRAVAVKYQVVGKTISGTINVGSQNYVIASTLWSLSGGTIFEGVSNPLDPMGASCVAIFTDPATVSEAISSPASWRISEEDVKACNVSTNAVVQIAASCLAFEGPFWTGCAELDNNQDVLP